MDFTELLIINSWLNIKGTAEGGEILFKIAGVELSINTSNGFTLEQVVDALEVVINNIQPSLLLAFMQ